MNSSASSLLTSSTSMASSNRKRKYQEDEEPTKAIIPSKRSRFYGTYIRQQPFSLPDSIMHYISKNPSLAQVYQKLAMSCKYFFMKNPIIIVSSLYFEYDEDEEEWEATFDGEIFDISSLKRKIWVTDELKILNDSNDDEEDEEECYGFPFMSNIYRSDVKKCTLEYVDISFDDLIFLGSKAEKLSFNSGVTVKNDEGSAAKLEKLMAAFPKVNDFSYNFYDTDSSNIITSNTAQALLQIPHFSNLKNFSLTDMPETLEIEQFYTYLKKNKTTKFHLEFDAETSGAFNQRLQRIIDEILAAETHDYIVPFISFETLESTVYDKLLSLSTF